MIETGFTLVHKAVFEVRPSKNLQFFFYFPYGQEIYYSKIQIF